MFLCIHFVGHHHFFCLSFCHTLPIFLTTVEKILSPFLNINGRLPPSAKIILLGDFNIRLGDRVNDTMEHQYPDTIQVIDYLDSIGLILESEHLDSPDALPWTHFESRQLPGDLPPLHLSVIDFVWSSPFIHSLCTSLSIDTSFHDSDHRPVLFSFMIPYSYPHPPSPPSVARPCWKTQSIVNDPALSEKYSVSLDSSLEPLLHHINFELPDPFSLPFQD